MIKLIATGIDRTARSSTETMRAGAGRLVRPRYAFARCGDPVPGIAGRRFAATTVRTRWSTTPDFVASNGALVMVVRRELVDWRYSHAAAEAVVCR